MQMTIDLEPSVNNKIELAYQIYLSGQYREAIQLYSDLSNAEHIPKAIEGIILCQIELNNINVEVNVFYILKQFIIVKQKYFYVIFRLKNKLNC